MDAATVIATIEGILGTVVKLAPAVEAGVASLTPIAQTIYNNLVGGNEITQAQLDALEAQVDALAAQIQIPLPPDDGTTTT